MTNEEKQLLIKDLKSRLYTKTQCLCTWVDTAKNGSAGVINELDTYLLDELEMIGNPDCECMFSDIKPYLRSIKGDIQCGRWDSLGKVMSNLTYLIENHYDINGLIEKGLAFEAPEGMYNF